MKIIKTIVLVLIAIAGIFQAIKSVQGCKPCGSDICPAICQAPGINFITIIYLIISVVAIYFTVKVFRKSKLPK